MRSRDTVRELSFVLFLLHLRLTIFYTSLKRHALFYYEKQKVAVIPKTETVESPLRQQHNDPLPWVFSYLLDLIDLEENLFEELFDV